MTDIDDVREREIIDTLLYLYLVSASRIWNKVQFIEIAWYCDRRYCSYQITSLHSSPSNIPCKIILTMCYLGIGGTNKYKYNTITYVNLREDRLLGVQAVICMKIC